MDVSAGVLTRAQLESYLDQDNVLIVRYISSEENAGIDARRYLPMLTVTVRDTDTSLEESGAAVEDPDADMVAPASNTNDAGV